MEPSSTLLRTETERVKRNLYRARRKGAVADLTIEQWLHICSAATWICTYCCERPGEVLKHRHPITAGGGTTASNVTLACVKCNGKKIRLDRGATESQASYRPAMVLPQT